MLKRFKKSENSESKIAIAQAQATSANQRKKVSTVPEKPVKTSRSPGPGLAKEVTWTTNKRQEESSWLEPCEEKNGEQDFLLGELQDLLDHEKSGKVKGEELRRILGSIGDRWHNEPLKFVWAIIFRLSPKELLAMKSFEDEDGMIEYERFLKKIMKLWQNFIFPF